MWLSALRSLTSPLPRALPDKVRTRRVSGGNAGNGAVWVAHGSADTRTWTWTLLQLHTDNKSFWSSFVLTWKFCVYRVLQRPCCSLRVVFFLCFRFTTSFECQYLISNLLHSCTDAQVHVATSPQSTLFCKRTRVVTPHYSNIRSDVIKWLQMEYYRLALGDDRMLYWTTVLNVFWFDGRYMFPPAPSAHFTHFFSFESHRRSSACLSHYC